ncbi:hypothetical protein CHUAL_003935 [Chamberlinius hualienensis]
MALVLITVLLAVISTTFSLPAKADYSRPAYYTDHRQYNDDDYAQQSPEDPPPNEIKSYSDVEGPTYDVKKPQIPPAAKPQYSLSEVRYETVSHPQVYLQEPRAIFAYPRYDQQNHYSPYNYEYSPHSEEFYDPVPKLYLISPPRVWLQSPRYSIRSPKVRVTRPPTYPKETKVDVKVEKSPELVTQTYLKETEGIMPSSEEYGKQEDDDNRQEVPYKPNAGAKKEERQYQ